MARGFLDPTVGTPTPRTPRRGRSRGRLSGESSWRRLRGLRRGGGFGSPCRRRGGRRGRRRRRGWPSRCRTSRRVSSLALAFGDIREDADAGTRHVDLGAVAAEVREIEVFFAEAVGELEEVQVRGSLRRVPAGTAEGGDPHRHVARLLEDQPVVFPCSVVRKRAALEGVNHRAARRVRSPREPTQRRGRTKPIEETPARYP